MSGAYPDGCGPADIPGCGSLYDPDAAFAEFMARCDDGEACYVCMRNTPMIAGKAGTFPVWICPHCGAESVRV
jgi:hypothetical protein